jgi:ribosome-associated toxin RatA of RatAB toxin-antitoxin module
MFDLVNEIEAYPKRFAWCAGSNVLERAEDALTARLEVRLAGLAYSFTTRNRLARPQRIEMALIEGPFRHLSGQWEFLALGQQGCKVILRLDIDFSGKLGGSALRLGFQSLASRLVDDFCRQADLAYG